MTATAFFLIGILLGASGAMFITSMRSATKLAAKDEYLFAMAPCVDAEFETFVRETQR